MNLTELKHSTTERNYSIDCLRIVCMLFVVVLHIIHPNMGMKGIGQQVFSFPWWLVNALRCLCNVAVNCFVLISGYYMSTSTVKPKKLLKLWVQVETYSIGMYLLCCVFHPDVHFEWKNLIRYACPLLDYKYWFFTMYFLLMLISPLLNVVIRNLKQKDYQKYLLILLALFLLSPSINIFGDRFGTNSGYSLIWFSVLYLVAGYIRKYPPRKTHYDWLYWGSSLLLLLLKVLCDVLTPYIGLASVGSNLIYQYCFVLVFAGSVSLFMCYLNREIIISEAGKRIISILSGLSFGIYLFHEHPQFCDILWGDFVRLCDVSGEPLKMAVRAAIALCCIVVIGMLLEFIRQAVNECFGVFLVFVLKKWRNNG